MFLPSIDSTSHKLSTVVYGARNSTKEGFLSKTKKQNAQTKVPTPTTNL
jgi:hypothetical protein